MAPLGLLRNLRVLMLGRNRITRIEGLDSLGALEVLDLHANRVRPIPPPISLTLETLQMFPRVLSHTMYTVQYSTRFRSCCSLRNSRTSPLSSRCECSTWRATSSRSSTAPRSRRSPHSSSSTCGATASAASRGLSTCRRSSASSSPSTSSPSALLLLRSAPVHSLALALSPPLSTTRSGGGI